jgi:hypothetical protein
MATCKTYPSSHANFLVGKKLKNNFMKSNDFSLLPTKKNDYGIELISDLEAVELKGGVSIGNVSASGVFCPSYSGNCVSGCSCTPTTPKV